MVRTERELWELGACSTVMLRAKALAEAARRSALTQSVEANAASPSEHNADTRAERPTAVREDRPVPGTDELRELAER